MVATRWAEIVRIAVDAMGGDFGPETNIHGVRMALDTYPKIQSIHIVGHLEQMAPHLQQFELSANTPKIELVHAETVVEMCEGATTALRKKRDSSIAIASRLLKEDKADALVSAGNTGAAVACMVFHTRMLPGIERPGIASVFPGPNGFFTVLDIGANVECKPLHLAQYALLGETYTRVVLGLEQPRIGLLNVGEEEHKGTDLTRAARKMISQMPLNFIGNIEGRDLFFDKADVVVCDGFVGNVVLKTCEGMAKGLIGTLKDSLNKSPIRRAGAWLSKNAYMELKELMDHEEYGGAPLMGTNGVCIIAHGSSSPRAICNAIRVSTEMVDAGFNQMIEKRSKEIGWDQLSSESEE